MIGGPHLLVRGREGGEVGWPAGLGCPCDEWAAGPSDGREHEREGWTGQVSAQRVEREFINFSFKKTFEAPFQNLFKPNLSFKFF